MSSSEFVVDKTIDMSAHPDISAITRKLQQTTWNKVLLSDTTLVALLPGSNSNEELVANLLST